MSWYNPIDDVRDIASNPVGSFTGYLGGTVAGAGAVGGAIGAWGGAEIQKNGLPGTAHNDFQAMNPGQVDLSRSNPELYAEISRLRGYQSQLDQNAKQSMDPAIWSKRRDMAQTQAEIAATNRFGRIGMAGSSAGMGAAQDAREKAGYAMDDRRQGEELRMLQMQNLLSGNITRDIMGGQGQFNQYQNMLMQREAAANASNSQLWGSIFGAAGSIGGGLLGAPGLLGGKSSGGGGGNYGGYNLPGADYTGDNFSMPEMGGQYGGSGYGLGLDY